MATHFKSYGYLVCGYAMLVPFQYGYHISALNQIQAVLTCQVTGTGDISPTTLPPCIPMSDYVFSLVTAIFTIGGLVGSLISNPVMDNWGRRGAIRTSASFVVTGTALMGLGSSVSMLSIGRFLAGVGSGLSICVSPIYLAEISPSRISGSVGVLTQLGIVLGIMVTQILGFHYAAPSSWRYVLLFSFALSVLQLLTSSFIVETPPWLRRTKQHGDAQNAAHRLWISPVHRPEDGDVEPLLDERTEHIEESHIPTATVAQLLSARDLRRPLLIVCFSMLSQQLSGINAVLYYSNAIFAKTLPNSGPFVSIAITVLNVIMTFPTIFLIERWGRQKLLLASISAALLSLFAVGYGLNAGYVTLASIAILTFVMSFAIGLGPIPFVLIAEVCPSHAVSTLSSVGLGLNWVANFLVGLSFLPLRNLLSSGDPTKEGRVFYAFAVLLFVFAFLFMKSMR